MNISKMFPEDVAKYACLDSRALSEVSDEDLLYELKTRLCSNANPLPLRMAISELLADGQVFR